jgi:hypothetical protein
MKMKNNMRFRKEVGMETYRRRKRSGAVDSELSGAPSDHRGVD